MPARKPVKKTTASKTSRVNPISSRKVTSAKKLQKSKATPLVSSQSYSFDQAKTYVKNPRFWVGVSVVVLAVLLFLYKGLFIAALVNGQPVSRFSVISQLEQQNGKQELSNLITQALVLQEAQKRNVTVNQSDIDTQVKKIEDTLKTQGTTLDAALAARGMSKSDLMQQIKLQALLTKMVGSTARVSDADVQAYIDKNQSTLPQDLTDDQLKTQVKQQLQQEALQNKTQTFLTDLQNKAKIQYFVNY